VFPEVSGSRPLNEFKPQLHGWGFFNFRYFGLLVLADCLCEA